MLGSAGSGPTTPATIVIGNSRPRHPAPGPPFVALGIKSKETIRTCLIQTGAKVSFDCDWATSRIPPVIDARAKGRGSTSPAELRMVVFNARPGLSACLEARGGGACSGQPDARGMR